MRDVPVVMSLVAAAACVLTACHSGVSDHAPLSPGGVRSGIAGTPVSGRTSGQASSPAGANLRPPVAPIPAVQLGRFTLDVPGAGTVTYRLLEPVCGARADVARLSGGGDIRLAGSTLTVAIPGLARRVVAVRVTHRNTHTRAGGVAGDGSAVSVMFPC